MNYVDDVNQIGQVFGIKTHENMSNIIDMYVLTCCLSFSKVSGSISVGGTLERASGESPSLDISLSLIGSSSPPEDCKKNKRDKN